MIHKKCKDCWWNLACQKTIGACQFIQNVDLHWEDSPNNKKIEELKEK